MWGAGTALGELPPYFMARTARLSGQAHEELVQDIEANDNNKAKKWMKALVERAGFFGILACASVRIIMLECATC